MQFTPSSMKSRAFASPTAMCTVVGRPTFFASSMAAAACVFVHRPDQLDAVGAAFFRLPHERAELIRRHRRTPRPAFQVRQHRVEHDPRRDDRVRGALGTPLLGLLEHAADFARGRHASRQVEVPLVLDRDRARRALRASACAC